SVGLRDGEESPFSFDSRRRRWNEVELGDHRRNRCLDRGQHPVRSSAASHLLPPRTVLLRVYRPAAHTHDYGARYSCLGYLTTSISRAVLISAFLRAHVPLPPRRSSPRRRSSRRERVANGGYAARIPTTCAPFSRSARPRAAR